MRSIRSTPTGGRPLPGFTLVEALLLEIAAALANGEVGDDQDHG